MGSAKMKMEWGLQIDTKQAMLRMMSSNDYEFDMALGVASRFEKDLEGNFDSNVVAVEPLGENHPTDMIWRKTVTHGMATSCVPTNSHHCVTRRQGRFLVSGRWLYRRSSFRLDCARL